MREPLSTTLKFVENCKYLLQLKNERIGDLEHYIGHGKGYFAKILNPSYCNTKISLDTAVKISEFFNITIEDILNLDNNTVKIIKLEKELSKLKEQSLEIETELERLRSIEENNIQ